MDKKEIQFYPPVLFCFEYNPGKNIFYCLISNILNMGTFRKRGQSFFPIIWVALEQELCLSSRSEYIRLIMSRLGLPSKYDYWLVEYLPIIPQKSITTYNNGNNDRVDNANLLCTK